MGKSILRVNEQLGIDYKQLLQELEAFRIEKGLSKVDVARKLGLRSYVAVWYWYKGRTTPYARTMYKMVQLLGKPITRQQLNTWNLRIDKKRRYKECQQKSK